MTTLPASAPAAPPLPAARGQVSWDLIGRYLLISLVFAYVGILVLSPLVALLYGAFSQGLAPILATLTSAEVLRAFGLTLRIAVICVVVHSLFGTAVAWVLVRGGSRF